MSLLTLYLVLAAYPLIVILVFDWKTAGWASKNRSFFLPPDLKAKAEKQGRFLFFIKFALLLILLRVVAGRDLWHVVPIMTNSRSSPVLIAWGVIGGAMMLACRYFFSALSPGVALTGKNEYFLRGPATLWLAVFVMGGFVEEFWRGFCIMTGQGNDFSSASSNLMAAIAFSIAHSGGIPSRIPGGLASIGTEIIIGLMLGGLFIWSGSVLPPYLASVVYYTSNFFIVRSRSDGIGVSEG